MSVIQSSKGFEENGQVRSGYRQLSGWRLLVVRLMVLVGLLVVWDLSSRLFDLQLLLSRPALVGERLVEFSTDPDFYHDARVTLVQTAIGFLAGSMSGLIVGALMGIFSNFGRVLNPFLDFANSVPRVALAPLFVFALGFGTASKVAIIVTIVFFVMATYAEAGVRNVDNNLILVSRTLGASRSQVFRTVLAPSMLVWLFPAIRLSVAYSFLGVVIGEFVGANAGLGFYILRAANLLDTAGVLAAIVVISVFSVCIIALLGRLEARVLRWQPSSVRIS